MCAQFRIWHAQGTTHHRMSTKYLHVPPSSLLVVKTRVVAHKSPPSPGLILRDSRKRDDSLVQCHTSPNTSPLRCSSSVPQTLLETMARSPRDGHFNQHRPNTTHLAISSISSSSVLTSSSSSYRLINFIFLRLVILLGRLGSDSAYAAYPRCCCHTSRIQRPRIGARTSFTRDSATRGVTVVGNALTSRNVGKCHSPPAMAV